MNVGSGLCSTAEGLFSTREYKDLWPSNSFEHTQRIPCGIEERGISMHGGDAQEIQLRVMSCKENRECVLRYVSVSYAPAEDEEALA